MGNPQVGGIGQDRLTGEAIDRLQNNYGLAVRKNTNSTEGMRKVAWALFFHTTSTNENPQHELCSPVHVSWCNHHKYININTSIKEMEKFMTIHRTCHML
jgi:hypothetical protein